MKILLDESIDIRLKYLFPAGCTVFTVKDMAWNGIKNGELLKLIAKNNFDVWVVVDKNIPYQQNINSIESTIIILDVVRNSFPFLEPLMEQVAAVLSKPFYQKIITLKHK